MKKIKKQSKKERIEMEQAGQQAFGAVPYGRYIQYGNPLNTLKLNEIEEICSYPTVKYCMNILMVVGDCVEWTVEADEDVPMEAVNIVNKFIDNNKLDVWRTAIDGWITNGYTVYEKVYQADMNNDGEYRINIRKLKPLLPEFLLINMDAEKGFDGVTVNMPRRVDLTADKCLILTNEKRGDDLRGRPILKAVKDAATGARTSLGGMIRYEEKLAKGPKYKVTYPYGTERDENGNSVKNVDKARQFVRDIEDSCFALLPRRKNVNPAQTTANQSDYELEMFAQDSVQSTFVGDLMFLDKLICRAFGLPERAILESPFGTRADAENGTDFVILRIQYLVNSLIDQLNKYCINPLMNYNYNGISGRIRIKAGSIGADDRKRISDLITSILATPYGQSIVVPNIDVDALMDTAKIPRLNQSETEGITIEQNPELKPDDEPGINDPPPESWKLMQ